MNLFKPYLSIFLFIVLASCTAHRLPPTLSHEQVLALKDAPFSNIVVGIKKKQHGEDNIPDYVVDKFRTLFEQTNLFKEVNYIDLLHEKPSIIAELKSTSFRPMCATGEASLMIMTLGIIPLKSSDDQTYTFTLSNSSGSISKAMEFTYINKSFMGSLITIINLSPNWSYKSHQSKNIDLLAYKLVSNKDEILKLAR